MDKLRAIQYFNRAVEAALTWVTDGLEAAMNKYNGTLPL